MFQLPSIGHSSTMVNFRDAQTFQLKNTTRSKKSPLAKLKPIKVYGFGKKVRVRKFKSVRLSSK